MSYLFAISKIDPLFFLFTYIKKIFWNFSLFLYLQKINMEVLGVGIQTRKISFPQRTAF